MINSFFTSLRAILVLTILTSVCYPLLVTGLGQIFFPRQANGSLIRLGEDVVGSALLAQRFSEPRYFWPRPSASDYGTLPSGASNQGFLSQKLQASVIARRALYGEEAPADLLCASGSGLDPHISPQAAVSQISRVASARSLPPEEIAALINAVIEPPQFGFLGEPRINVLMLNLRLDKVHSPW